MGFQEVSRPHSEYELVKVEYAESWYVRAIMSSHTCSPASIRNDGELLFVHSLHIVGYLSHS